MNKMRLDKLLQMKGITNSREKAAKMIKEGKIKVNGETISKSSKEVDDMAIIEVSKDYKEYVGRGALKLIEALNHWNIEVNGMVCADLGASTGGFTEVLLERGADFVYAIDVGIGQLATCLRSNPKVLNIEKTNVKDLNKEFFEKSPDIVTIDLSFISLEKIIETLGKTFLTGTKIIALIKPQFELSKKELNRQGVVKNSDKYEEVLRSIRSEFEKQDFLVQEIIDSPILGGEGNKEFLIYCIKK